MNLSKMTRQQLIKEVKKLQKQLTCQKPDAGTIDKVVKKAVEQCEKRFQGLLNNMAEIVWRIDLKGRLTYVSKPASKMLDYRPQEMIGKNISGFLAPETAKKARQSIQKRLNGEYGDEPITLELQAKRKDKSIITLETRTMPIYDTDGHIVEIQGVSRDTTQRKEAEMILRDSEERLHSLLRAAPIGIGIVSNRVLTRVNQRLCQMTGYKQVELLGKKSRVLYPTKKDYDYVGKVKYAQISKKGTGTVETRWKHKDGRIIDILLSSTPLDPKDLTKGVTFTATDITELKTVERALRNSELRFRALVETSSDWIWEVDREGRFTYSSPNVTDILGYTPKDLIGKKPLDLMSPQEAQKRTPPFNRVLRNKKAFKGFVSIQLHKKGHAVILESNGTPIFDDRGYFRGFRGINRDITERHRAEDKLRQSERRYRELFEGSRDGIVFVDAQGNFVECNQQYEQMLGYTIDELRKMDLYDITPKKWHQWERKEIIEKRIFAQGYSDLYEKEYIRKDGTVFPVDLQAYLIRDDDGHPVGMWGVARDITARQQAQTRIIEYQQRLRELASQLSLTEEQQRRQIAGDLHDHISQSLVLSLMKLQQLKDSADCKNKALVRSLCDTLNQVIERVRTMTFELGSPTLYRFGLEPALRELLDEKFKQNSEVQTHFSDDKKPKPLSEDVKILLFQSVRELLVNVVKHARADRVDVAVSRDNSDVEISVHDNGVGFDPSIIDTPAHRGVHFGLFNIHERLNYLDGSMTIESKKNEGSTFTLTAPLQK